MKQVTYLGYYKSPKCNTRSAPLAAVSKMQYIITVLLRLGCKLKVLSPANANNTTGFIRKAEEVTEEGFTVSYLPTYGGHSLCSSIIRKCVYNVSLLSRLLTIPKNTTLVVYHSLGYARLVRFAKRIRNFRLILEVEEIYQDVKKYTNRECKAEYEIIDAADAYIFSTRLLNDTLNKNNKPYTISSGNYLSEPRVVEQLHDGITHVVYAGTFDSEKGGAIAAIKAALYLAPRFHVHILGFGSRKDVENVIELIKRVNAQTEACVSYEGTLIGKPFIEFLQRCHIGLSTQSPTGQYNDTSFPSKILTYLSNGLKVVSIAIPVVAKSSLAKSLFLYNSSNPQAIAEAILEAEKTSNKDSETLLCNLDRDFSKSISELI